MASETKATLQIVAQAVDKFSAPMAAMQSALHRFGSSARRIAENVASFAIFKLGQNAINWTKDLASNVVQLDAHARRLGISTEALSRWQFAAEAAGISAHGFESGLLKIQSAIEKARNGTFDYIEVFDALGVRIDEFTRPLDILPQIAEGFARLQNPADKATASMRLLGNESNELMGLLGLGRERLAELQDEADEFGATIDSKTVKSLKDFELALHKLETVARFFGRTVLTTFADEITPAIERFAHFLAANKETVVQFFVAAEKQVLQWAKNTLGALFEVGKAISKLFGKMTEEEAEKAFDVWNRRVAQLTALRAVAGLDEARKAELAGAELQLEAMRKLLGEYVRARENAETFEAALQRLTVAWEKSGTAAEKSGTQMQQATILSVQGLDGIEEQAKKTESKINSLSWDAGIKKGMLALEERYRNVAAVGQKAVTDLADAFENRLGEAIFAAMNDWKHFGDAMKKVAASFLQDIQRMIAQVIAFRIASRLFGSLFGGGDTSTGADNVSGSAHTYKREGGFAGGRRVWQFAGGGMVPGTRTSWDTVPAMLSPREFVMRTQATDYYGAALMQALNRQQVPRDALSGRAAIAVPVAAAPAAAPTVIENHYHISAMDSQDVMRALMKAKEGFSGMVRQSVTEDRATMQAVRGIVR